MILLKKDYTVDSWKAFKEALDHAKDVFTNENTTQDEVDQALASLQDAIKNLKQFLKLEIMINQIKTRMIKYKQVLKKKMTIKHHQQKITLI